MNDETLDRLVKRIDDLDVHFLPTGKASVINPENGHRHKVTLTDCDCEDFANRNGGTYDGLCKHIIARRIYEPCPMCGGHMALNEFDDFVCRNCGYAVMGSIVRLRREAQLAHKEV